MSTDRTYPPFTVTVERLSLDAVIRSVQDETSVGPAGNALPGMGAVASFLGLVRGRNLGRRVLRLHYDAFEPLAIRAFERIADEAGGRWPAVRLGIHHRVGTLEIGEVSVAIAAASAHRADAFSACRYAIERIKQIAPIWKHEYFDGGDVWIEGATADPEDELARDQAWRIACASP